MEGHVLVYNNIHNNKNSPSESLDENSDLSPPSLPPSPSPTGNPKTFTKVYHGSGNANDVLLGFIDRAKTKIDSCVSYNAPSVIIETDAIREKRKEAVSQRGLKIRYVTEITPDNVDHVRQMRSFSEIRHLDGLRGNFEVADQREYVAVATLQKAQPIPQLIFSNIAEVVEQQQFVFDSFWKMATPAKQRIREIEHGVIPAETIVYSDYRDAVKKELEMIKNAKKEIQIMYSTVNAFHIQEKDGILHLLKEKAEQNENLRISILSPIDTSVKNSSYLRFLNHYSQNIRIQDIAPSISIKIKSLVVDRKESLIMELRHLKEENATALIGFSFYSNSESTVLSYASIFEVLYNQSILFEQLKQEDSVKNEFIDIAAHELRTPIMPILNGMEILEEKLGDKVKEYRREIDIITRNASRLQNLAESILQVSRIESGTFSLSVQSGIDIHSLIAQVIEDVEKKYAYTDKAGKVSMVFLPLYDTEREREMEEETAKSIDRIKGSSADRDKRWDNSNTPAPPKQTGQMENVQETSESTQNDNNYNDTVQPLYVDCDSQKIAQVIFNLLDNAMKFTLDGKIYVSTSITKDEHPQSASSSSPLPNSDSASNDHYDASLPNTNTVAVASAATAASKTRRNIKTNANGNNKNGNGNVYWQTSSSSSSRVLVSVRDTGIGINSQIKDQLFEKFATKSRQGTGLGLYLSKKIIESHGGNIWHEEPTKENDRYINDGAYNNGDSIKTGTIFKFSIPMTISKNKSIENRK